MVEVYNNRGKYILVTNLRQLDYDLSTADRVRTGPVQMTFDTCWDGDRWVHTPSLAMTFGSRELANEYYAANQARLTELA
jgi:hypothetical protein